MQGIRPWVPCYRPHQDIWLYGDGTTMGSPNYLGYPGLCPCQSSPPHITFEEASARKEERNWSSRTQGHYFQRIKYSSEHLNYQSEAKEGAMIVAIPIIFLKCSCVVEANDLWWRSTRFTVTRFVLCIYCRYGGCNLFIFTYIQTAASTQLLNDTSNPQTNNHLRYIMKRWVFVFSRQFIRTRMKAVNNIERKIYYEVSMSIRDVNG